MAGSSSVIWLVRTCHFTDKDPVFSYLSSDFAKAIAGKCFEKFHRPIKRGGMAYILNEKVVFYDLITIKKGCISWDIEEWDVLEYLFLRYAWGQ
jgi:hypothetical protein